MVKTVDATYDGRALQLDHPLELEPNTRVRITVEVGDTAKSAPYSFLKVARSLNLKTPPDWSRNIDSYLYGKSEDAD